MPANAYREPDRVEMPRELQLDLLVDAELPEEQRHALLLALDREPSGRAWRELAIRFLQRQVEQQSVRQLMDGGSVVPVTLVPVLKPERRLRFSEWLGGPGTLAVAAGLLIAVASATVTFYVLRPAGSSGTVAPGEPADMRLVSLPGQSMGVHEAVPVRVPVMSGAHERASDLLFRNTAQDPGGAGGSGIARRSVVIQPDENGNACVIPVNTMTMKVY